MHKLTAQIHGDKLDEFDGCFGSEFAHRKDAYTVESFKRDPNSYGVRCSVSFKIARQADVHALKAFLDGIGAGR